MSVKLWIDKEMYMVDEQVRDEFDRLAEERDAAIKEVGVWSRKCGLLESENAELRKRIEEMEQTKSTAVPSTYQFLNDPAEDIYDQNDGERIDPEADKEIDEKESKPLASRGGDCDLGE